MTTKTRTICTECADRYYEYEIGAESDEYCPACLFTKYKKALEEVEDTKQWASELEDSRKEQEDEATELVKERDELVKERRELVIQLTRIEKLCTKLYTKLEGKCASEIITIKLGTGIVEVLQLDSAGVCTVLGIEWEPVGKGRKHIRVRATREGLGNLLRDCRDHCSSNWAQPAHYTRRARTAAERLEAIL